MRTHLHPPVEPFRGEPAPALVINTPGDVTDRVDGLGVGVWGDSTGLKLADTDANAVFVANDHMALGLLCAMREVGRRVPGDLSVVGFDDLPEAAIFSPPLTTVHQDFGELGRHAIDVVVRALNFEVRPRSEPVVPHLVERKSVRPLL